MKAKNSFVSALVGLPSSIWHSIFRNPLPHSDLGRAQTSFTNFFLHIHPVKVHRNTIKPWYTMGLGLITFYLFLILVVSGILLMFYYVPATTQAYDRMLDLRGTVAFGTFLRNMHRWSAHGMVAVVFLHMCRVFFTGSYKKPREFNWVIGVILFLLTLFSSFTGYLLPWDQLAFWAITVGSSIAGYAPVIGADVKFLLLGDTTVGQEALLRFYVLHIAVLPVAVTFLVSIHFWRIRKDGGLSRPEESEVLSDSQSSDVWPKEIDVTPATPAPRGGDRRPAGRNHREETIRHTGPGARTVHQGRQRAGQVGLQLAESVYGRAVCFCDHAGWSAGGLIALQCSSGRARQSDSSAESGQSAMVLSGPAGDGELLGFLGRCRDPDP
ncbi:MAG: cytochrome b N-terminal domain-containing protein [Acidobacteria bacterium]|nr:cytochrome b N-terminal domain-containing protein [Acidobacteriota bacterium]